MSTTKHLVRSIKNVTNGYSRAEVTVRNATSNDPWDPTGLELDEIAELTNHGLTFYSVMDMLDKRLNDKGKNWRHVLKALIVLDYCLRFGSEDVVRWAKDNIFLIKTLREFQYIDNENQDQGRYVRAKAKQVTEFLKDENKIRAERTNRRSTREKLYRNYDDLSRSSDTMLSAGNRRRAYTLPPRSSNDADMSIEELKKSHELQVQAKREANRGRDRLRALSAAAGTLQSFQDSGDKHHDEEFDRKQSELLFGAVKIDNRNQSSQKQAQEPVPRNAQLTQNLTGAPNPYQTTTSGQLSQNALTGAPNSYQTTSGQSSQNALVQLPLQQLHATGIVYANSTGQLQPVPQQYPQLTGQLYYQSTGIQTPIQYGYGYQLAAYPTGMLAPQGAYSYAVGYQSGYQSPVRAQATSSAGMQAMPVTYQ